jgi:hypothetical protein
VPKPQFRYYVVLTCGLLDLDSESLIFSLWMGICFESPLGLAYLFSEIGVTSSPKTICCFYDSTLVGYGIHPHSGLEELEQ